AESAKVGKGEVINIGAGRNFSVGELAKLILRTESDPDGIGGKVEYIASRLEPHDSLADTSLAQKLLGWEPEVTLEEGIEELKKLYGLK
ncbi:MAG: hypothetical protein AAB968_01840, partial [Patescibacteria group bacterium]